VETKVVRPLAKDQLQKSLDARGFRTSTKKLLTMIDLSGLLKIVVAFQHTKARLVIEIFISKIGTTVW
jgi:hypothetical protein